VRQAGHSSGRHSSSSAGSRKETVRPAGRTRHSSGSMKGRKACGRRYGRVQARHGRQGRQNGRKWGGAEPRDKQPRTKGGRQVVCRQVVAVVQGSVAGVQVRVQCVAGSVWRQAVGQAQCTRQAGTGR